MTLKKKIIIGVSSLALVAVVALTAVFAANSFTTTATASVSYSGQLAAKVEVAITGQTTKTFNIAATGVVTNSGGTAITASNGKYTQGFGTITFSSATTVLTATITVTNQCGRALAITITPTNDNRVAGNVLFSDMTNSGSVTAITAIGGTASGTQIFTATQTMQIKNKDANASVTQNYVIALSVSA